MHRPPYSIRPALDADLEFRARLARRIDPKHAATAEAIRHWATLVSLPPDHVHPNVIAEVRESGPPVGCGRLAQPSFNFDPRRFWVWGGVDLPYRRKGVGSAIDWHLEQEALARDGLGFWATTIESNPAGVGFLRPNGFRVLRKSWPSGLALATLENSTVPDRSAAFEREGVRAPTLAAEGPNSPGIRRKMDDWSELTRLDVPRLGTSQPASFEDYVATDLDAPGALPGGDYLALQGSNLLGRTCVERGLARPDTLRVGYTRTHPNVRGRGIAPGLRRRAALFAPSGATASRSPGTSPGTAQS